jgi:uncharacterized membrane protein YuzA (DUF378 family)
LFEKCKSTHNKGEHVLKRRSESEVETMTIIDRIALIITVVGALNWGSIGLFQFDLVAWLCGGAATLLARVIYTVVALAGIWCISLIFRSEESIEEMSH